MRVDELMVGDYVCYDSTNNYITKVLGIRPSSDGDENNYAIICSRDIRDPMGNPEFWELMSVDILSPIIITHGMLADNGFVCHYNSDGYDEWSYYEGSYQVLCMYDKDGCFELNKFIEIQYVHELQRTMRLCNINEEIIL